MSHDSNIPVPDEEEEPQDTAEETTNGVSSVISMGAPADPPPNSAAPPRILAETPLGGVARPASRAQESAPVTPPDPETPTTPGSVQASELRAQKEEASRPQPEPASSPASAPELPEPSDGEDAADTWDDDISPELAAVLFQPAKTEPAPPEPAETSVAEVKPARDTAEPVHLTDTDQARHTSLWAEGVAAPAPDAALSGKARYVRIEEPYDDDGARIEETWTYIKPHFPALEGRLVREVRQEEIRHADGSWEWRYERRYTDRGSDRRQVRASADRAYIERADDVSKIEADSGKRLHFAEEVAMIFAAPERDEKRGLLSSIFSRDEATDAASDQQWREASAADSRQARKQGGAAFKRGFLGL